MSSTTWKDVVAEEAFSEMPARRPGILDGKGFASQGPRGGLMSSTRVVRSTEKPARRPDFLDIRLSASDAQNKCSMNVA